MTHDERNDGLTAVQVTAYEQFDGCVRICTQFCQIHGKSATQVAEAIITAGIDTDKCLSGLDGIACPYGASRPQVIQALSLIVVRD